MVWHSKGVRAMGLGNCTSTALLPLLAKLLLASMVLGIHAALLLLA